MSGGELPAIITALTALVVAVTTLVQLLRTNQTVNAIHTNTDGQLSSLQDRIAQLMPLPATAAELAARAPQPTLPHLTLRADDSPDTAAAVPPLPEELTSPPAGPHN